MKSLPKSSVYRPECVVLKLKNYGHHYKTWFLKETTELSSGDAVVYSNGWHRLHREDGPAFVDMKAPRHNTWYLYGKECTKTMHKKLTKSSNAELLLLMGQGYDEYIEQRLKKGGNE